MSNNVILPLLAALWACTSLVFTVTKELNAIRDRVIWGENGKPLPDGQGEHLMRNDWFPMCICIICVCVGFSGLSAAMPFMIPDSQTSGSIAVCLCVAGFSFLMAAAWIPSGRRDWKAMESACAANRPCPGTDLPTTTGGELAS